MIFDNYQIKKNDTYIKISAEAMVVFKNSYEEIEQIGIPKWWNEVFFKCIDLSKFNMYFVLLKTLLHGEYNKITDYHKVWGLSSVGKGEFENNYFSQKGKVYFGLKQVHEENGLFPYNPNLILLLPKKSQIRYNDIFELFKLYEVDLCYEPKILEEKLSKIQNKLEEIILIKYCCNFNPSLSIYGGNVNVKDFERYFKQYNNQDVEIVCTNII